MGHHTLSRWGGLATGVTLGVIAISVLALGALALF
jgi:hypothetical protein